MIPRWPHARVNLGEGALDLVLIRVVVGSAQHAESCPARLLLPALAARPPRPLLSGQTARHPVTSHEAYEALRNERAPPRKVAWVCPVGCMRGWGHLCPLGAVAAWVQEAPPGSGERTAGCDHLAKSAAHSLRQRIASVAEKATHAQSTNTTPSFSTRLHAQLAVSNAYSLLEFI